MSSLHNAVLHLSTFIYVLYQEYTWPVTQMNYTPHHICLLFMYVLPVSCISVLSLQTLITQVQVCFSLLMKVTNFS